MKAAANAQRKRRAGPRAQQQEESPTLHALPSSPPPVKPAADLRRKRARRLVRNLALWVGLPTLLASVYYAAIVTPQYESVSVFKVESADGSAGAAPLAGFLGSLAGHATGNQTLVVRDFVLSREMLNLLAQDHALLSHFQATSIDWLSRLSDSATSEEAFEYYLDQLDVTYDSESGVLTLQARAFDAETAHAVNQAILKASEHMVNSLSRRAQADAIQFSESEVERAQARVSKARTKLLSLQAQNGEEFNPLAAAQAVQTIVAQLEAELAKARADLNATTQVMGPRSPQAMQQRQQVASLENEMRKQKRRLVPGEDEQDVAASIARYEPVVFEKEFAERSLQSALASMELARVDAARQHRYLAVIAPPSSPDAPTYPDRTLGVLRVLALSLVLAGLGGLVASSIREHARV